MNNGKIIGLDYRKKPAEQPKKELPEKCCGKCLWFRESDVNPATMQRETVCNWGPPHCTTIPAQGGIMKTSQFPPVRPEWGCGQFTPPPVGESA